MILTCKMLSNVFHYNHVLSVSPCVMKSLHFEYFNVMLYGLEIVKKVKESGVSRVQLFATLWTVDYQAPRSLEFSRQEY